jgi:hypothetical protein
MSIKNSSDTIGNRTHDLPVCSAVPQPTAPARPHMDTELTYRTYRDRLHKKTSTEHKLFENKVDIVKFHLFILFVIYLTT